MAAKQYFILKYVFNYVRNNHRNYENIINQFKYFYEYIISQYKP